MRDAFLAEGRGKAEGGLRGSGDSILSVGKQDRKGLERDLITCMRLYLAGDDTRLLDYRGSSLSSQSIRPMEEGGQKIIVQVRSIL